LKTRIGPGKPTAAAPHLQINNVNAYHGRLKRWLDRFNGVATKNLPNYLGWRRALEAWGDLATPQNWIKSAIGDGPYQQLTLLSAAKGVQHAVLNACLAADRFRGVPPAVIR